MISGLMQAIRRWLRGTRALPFALVIGCLAAPATADIASFNAAMNVKDYKTAAHEAIATWPSLDKSRDDIALIANEFGFAAYAAGEFSHARTFANFAAENAAPGADRETFVLMARILSDAANLRIEDNKPARNALHTSLLQRESMKGFDLISYLGATALVVYDLEESSAKDAAQSARLAATMTAAGGEGYRSEMRRFEMYEQIAIHRRRPSVDSLRAFNQVRQQIIADIANASSDEMASSMTPIYWQAYAWLAATESYLSSSGGSHFSSRIPSRADRAWDDCDCDPRTEELPERVTRILGSGNDDPACERDLSIRPAITFPFQQRRRGRIGAVVIAVTVNEAGEVSNGRLLAAVPETHFARAVLDRVPGMSYHRAEAWNNQTCTLADDQRVITVSFTMG
jgi:hypothetical protein